MSKVRVGFAMCGSFCTFEKIINSMKSLTDNGYELTPIMSPAAYNTDTRFGKAEDFRKKIEEICGKKIINTIVEAEPIGPKSLLDIMVIAPCTGNTLAKLAAGVTDTSVTMAAKAHLRGEKPLLIALATNDALSASARNIGDLLNRKHIYFVPFEQDDSERKPRSMISRFDRIEESIKAALQGKQIQPIMEKKEVSK
jgi:dipicolinate synthase subunit B